MIPSIDSSFRSFSQVSASFFQSANSMFSDHFENGFSIFTMLQISFNSGAIFRISSASVGITPPVFGSSREEIVPPVMIIATFLSFSFFSSSTSGFSISLPFSITVASRISPSRIPMLYPDFSFRRMISGSCDSKMCPSHVLDFVLSLTLSPGLNVFVCMIEKGGWDIKSCGLDVMIGWRVII